MSEQDKNHVAMQKQNNILKLKFCHDFEAKVW